MTTTLLHSISPFPPQDEIIKVERLTVINVNGKEELERVNQGEKGLKYDMGEGEGRDALGTDQIPFGRGRKVRRRRAPLSTPPLPPFLLSIHPYTQSIVFTTNVQVTN